MFARYFRPEILLFEQYTIRTNVALPWMVFFSLGLFSFYVLKIYLYRIITARFFFWRSHSSHNFSFFDTAMVCTSSECECNFYLHTNSRTFKRLWFFFYYLFYFIAYGMMVSRVEAAAANTATAVTNNLHSLTLNRNVF